MQLGKWFWLVAICALLASRAHAQSSQTLNLKPFVPASTVDTLGADWAVLRGHQVLDGVPFQIDGAVLFRGTNSAQKAHPGRTNLDNLLVGQKFDVLHLLAATDVSSDNGTAAAKIHFHYADGTENILPVLYGEHVLCWQAVWHKTEDTTNSSTARMAWHGQDSAAAQADKYRCLFHVTLANPSPDKEVRELSIESANTQPGLLLLAATISPISAEKLPDTISAGKNPFPDSRPRNGELARGEGVVKSNDGHPLAHALIRVAAVRDLGTDDKISDTQSPLAGQGAETDDTGHFILPPLPDNHLYRLVIWAEGYETIRYRGMDPKSDPIEVRLKPLTTSSPSPKYVLHGRVIGPGDKPIPFVLVEHDGVGAGGGGGWGGSQGFADGVIANANGEFSFGRDQEFNRLQISIKVPGLAPAHEWVPVTNAIQTVRLVVGATIRGRVLKDGQPLTNMSVGVSGSDRNSEVWAGNFDAKTSTNGEFIFEHLPPDTAWDFYGKMDSFKKYGAMPPRRALTAGDRQTTDLGDLTVQASIHLAGQVKVRNGESLPKGLKVRVGYEDAWDSQSVPVDKDGHFKLDGLSAHLVQVSLDIRGWHLSTTNRSLDNWNPFELTGVLEDNKDDLLLVIEKGNYQYNYYGGTGNGQLPTADQSRSRPLFGAEDSGPPYIILAGSVLDDATGKPINDFKVTPGHKPPVVGPPMAQPRKPLLAKVLEPFARKNNNIPWNERIYWDFARAETNSNGTFSVPFVPLTSTPVLMVEAKGYEPLETDPSPNANTNLVLRLKKGVGPNGIVLLPNGNPAKSATVIFGISQEQFSLSGTSLTSYGNKQAQQTTAADGKFSFDGRSEGRTLFVAHPAGWAQYDLSHGSNNITLELRPWAAIVGTLIDSNGVPQVGVKLALGMAQDWSRGDAMVNIQGQIATDSRGQFVFSNVPPARVNVDKVVPMSGSSWTSRPQTWLVVQPGVTNDLGKVVLDRPPPVPAMDRIKQSLGL